MGGEETRVSLNLHNIVRPIVRAVNPDQPGVWLQSIGATTAPDGSRLATYSPPIQVQLQLQPPSTRDLQHIEFLNLQGVIRTVYMYLNPNGVVRVAAKGGDLLMFMQAQPQFLRDSNGQLVLDGNSLPIRIPGVEDGWLVVAAPEWWDVSSPGWSKLFVTLQTDGRIWLLDDNGLPVLDQAGRLVYAP